MSPGRDRTRTKHFVHKSRFLKICYGYLRRASLDAGFVWVFFLRGRGEVWSRSAESSQTEICQNLKSWSKSINKWNRHNHWIWYRNQWFWNNLVRQTRDSGLGTNRNRHRNTILHWIWTGSEWKTYWEFDFGLILYLGRVEIVANNSTICMLIILRMMTYFILVILQKLKVTKFVCEFTKSDEFWKWIYMSWRIAIKVRFWIGNDWKF